MCGKMKREQFTAYTVNLVGGGSFYKTLIMNKDFAADSSTPIFGYSDDEVLKIKKEAHRLYSGKQINLDYETVKRLRLRGSESILDIGCGLGDFLIYLRKIGHKGLLVGLDLYPETFKEAERKALLERLNIQFIGGNATDLPFKNEFFDVVCARHMLCYLPSISMGLKEAERVLKNSGTFLATANSIKSYPHVHKYLARLKAELYLDPYVYATERFSSENMEEILKGFFDKVKIVKLRGDLKFDRLEPFFNYFKVRRGVLYPEPTLTQWNKALRKVTVWIKEDFQKERTLYEPKWASIGLCKK